MFGWLSRKAKKNCGPLPGPAAPDGDLYVIGDIHGCSNLLDRLLEKLGTQTQIICVGDLVDRGEQSATVLRTLFQRKDIICLQGNHEAMMLSFIENPEKAGSRWLRYGGLQTLASFGVSGVSEAAGPKVMSAARDDLVAKMGDDLLNWLVNLPSSYTSGNIAVVHAGADPMMPIESQSPKTLAWGHPDFGKVARPDQLWVIYGHVIHSDPQIENGCVAIDTGAYATGTLTAAHVRDGEFDFITA